HLTGDEVPLPDGVGRMANFERGPIYWSPTTAAHPVVGDILNIWAENEFELGDFGYPVADQINTSSGVLQEFQWGATIAVDTIWSGVVKDAAGRACPFVTKTDRVHVSTSRNPDGSPQG